MYKSSKQDDLLCNMNVKYKQKQCIITFVMGDFLIKSDAWMLQNVIECEALWLAVC